MFYIQVNLCYKILLQRLINYILFQNCEKQQKYVVFIGQRLAFDCILFFFKHQKSLLDKSKASL